MAVKHMLVALLAVAAASAVVEARLFHDEASARQLLQSSRCPAGCDTNGCVLDSTSGGYKCTKCAGALTVDPDTGKCGCPAGRYIVSGDCQDCPKGSYCEGGIFEGGATPASITCPSAKLTTIGKRSTSKKACVNVPGSSYTTTSSGDPDATTCPKDTYGPGLRKQRACVPCPPGYVTLNDGQSTSRSCVVPEGYYLKGPGQVAPCPKGEWKSGFQPLPSCTKCANGVSTKNEASTAETACTEVLPTFYPKTISGGVVKETAKCPQKFYCPGGSPNAAFSPVDLDATGASGNTVVKCSYGTWTENYGASSAEQCMTPPGYKTDMTTDVDTATTPCGAGTYRADWKPASAAATCVACGDSIFAEATEQITQYDASSYAASSVAVAATAASCYIKPGQGMYFSAASSTYRAVNCDSNNYGVSNKTFGLAAFPCRDCPAGMQTSISLPNSFQYWAEADSTTKGFTSPMACVTQAGFGYNGRVANKCPAGSYNAAGNYGTCTQCAVGLSTPDNSTQQVDSTNCAIAPGYGYHNSQVQPCPVGTYNDLLRSDKTTPCTSCPAGFSTSQTGGRSAEDCNVCQPGFGGATCASTCGASNGANYGPAGRDKDQPACVDCPTMVTGFSFDYQGTNMNFTPAAVARSEADSPADCLAEFAQIADAAWQMGGDASALVNVTDVDNSVNTFPACVANCKSDAACMYITYDYDAQDCFKRVAAGAGSSGSVVAFKAVTAGDTTAASKVDAKGLSSGSYTFWKAESPVGIGAGQVDNAASTVQACMSACDDDFDCAGIAMTGASSMSATGVGCKLIKGDKTIAVFKRSVTKAVATKLQL